MIGHSTNSPLRNTTAVEGRKLQEICDRLASTTDREPFQYFGDKNEERDDQGGEELPDDQRCQQGQSHGQFHGHPPLAQVLKRFGKDGEPAHEHTDNTQPSELGNEPHDAGHNADECDSQKVSSFDNAMIFVS